jgi:hypothetical protein
MRYFWLALTAVVTHAHAGEAVLEWQLPTASEVCTSDPAVPEIASTEIWQLITTGGPDDTSVTLSGLMPGNYTYVASVTDTEGNTSRITAPVEKTIDSITAVDDKAYIIVQSEGKFTAFIIGTVPVGTVCDANTMVQGVFNFQPFTGYGVPVESVTVTGNVEPVLVVAACR